MGKMSKKCIGIVMALILIIASVPVMASQASDTSLMADQLEQGKLVGMLESGIFQIRATTEKSVTIDSNNKVAEDGTSFAQRIKLGGSGSADYRSVHFSLTGTSSVTVYAMSSSSSSDRALDLYGLDGTLIDSMEAPGSGLNMKVFTVEAGDYYLASPSSGVNLYGVDVKTKAGFEAFSLGISSLGQEELSTSKEVNGITIAATSEKKVKIDSNSKTAEDGTSFSQRLKLGGSGSADYRSIHFNALSKAEVTVYAMSSSSSSDRALDLYGLDGTLIDSMEAPGAGLNMKMFTVEAGDYYLASPSSGVNVYDVVVVSAGSAVAVKRLDWDQVAGPVITGITASDTSIEVAFDLVTGTNGADKAEVTMMDTNGKVIGTNLVGRSTEDNKTTTFTPDGSGTYKFRVVAKRNGVEEVKPSLNKTFTYALPLEAPVLQAFNKADGSISVKWNSIKEATSYAVETKETAGNTFTNAITVEGTEGIVSGLTVGQTYEMRVRAIRGGDEAVSEVISKKVKTVDEREWAFTYFGQSISSSRNTFEMVDEDALTFKLNSATIKGDGTIDGKGGKFTNFHDGISYYYTKVDPTTENFELTATFTVEFINPTPDGQEGFGLLAMDTLGEFGVSSVNHYTNSAGVIATKFEETIDGIKYTSKDTLGSRFVSNITDEVLAAGATGIADHGKSVKGAFSYDEADLIKSGESYTLTLKKTNTGYHTSIKGEDEVILYGVDKLLQLDADNLYVGFAVARGCNVTVSGVSFTTSDPATDPVAMEEPVELVTYTAKIDAPTTTSSGDYEFIYVTNVPGTLTVTDASGHKVIDSVAVNAGVDYTKMFELTKGSNSYSVAFTPEATYVPGENQLLDSYETITMSHVVTYKTYSGSKLYVSASGTAEGSGAESSPLDIETALLYAKPGQTVVLSGGVYMMRESLIIPRGNDGTSSDYKIMTSAEGERAILNFSKADSGMVNWGNYWKIMNIDITETPGNKKGLQIAGDYNIISGVNAYKNGDTGIQISGTSAETIEKWPTNNLILNCTSYNNMDPGMNNADGFAAKLTIGEGNVFDGCMAYNNLDDGWDLFAKIESGPIGKVVIKNSIAFNNGTLTDGTGMGDGNGFKLGGDGIAIAHELIDSVAFNNNAAGITSNSNPAVVIKNSTSYGNGRNIALYGKGSDSRLFVLENVISMAGVSDDNIDEMPELASETNYLSIGGIATNSLGSTLDSRIFESTDVTITPERNRDGSIDMKGLLILNDLAPNRIGGVVGSAGGNTYTVKAGDTLSKLALMFYEDAKKWSIIFEGNKNLLSDPNRIFIGQEIIIP